MGENIIGTSDIIMIRKEDFLSSNLEWLQLNKVTA